jgi:hypothetical protein
MISIKVRGLAEITRALGDPNLLGSALRPALERAGTIVEAGWKRRVHTVTRKYQGSLGHRVDDLSVRIGPQPGYGSPRRYTRGQTGAWKTPRDGTNRGDPREYALFEDQGTRYRPGHPAAEPALAENVDEVVDALVSGISDALNRRFP